MMKQNRVYLIVIIILLIGDVFAAYVCIRYRHQLVDIVDNYYRSHNSAIRNSHPVRFAELGKLEDDTTQWYCLHKVVAHGGGGIDNKTCTDSWEGILLHYQNGTRMFDIDMAFTSDCVLVCRHGWTDNLEQDVNFKASDTRFFQWDIEQLRYNIPLEKAKVPDYDTFRNFKPHHKYTPLSVDEFLDFMEEHSDVWVLADLGYIASAKYDYLYNVLLKRHSASVRDRVVVTFNTYDDLQKLRDINPKVKVQLKRYGMTTENYYDVARFCVENSVHAVNISAYNVEDSSIALLKEHGIHVFVAAIDYLSDFDHCMSKGASGIVSNFLFENDLKLKRNGF